MNQVITAFIVIFIFSIIIIFNYTYLLDYEDDNIIEIFDNIDVAKHYCTIYKTKDKIILNPEEDLVVNGEMIDKKINLLDYYPDDIFNFGDFNVKFKFSPFIKYWETLFEKELYDLNNRYYTAFRIFTHHNNLSGVKVSKDRLGWVEDGTLLTILPPKGKTVLPRKLAEDENLFFAVNDSICFLKRESTEESLIRFFDQKIYIVESGDNLYNLSNQLNCEIEDIKKMNNLQNDVLQIGQPLKFRERKLYKLENNDIIIVRKDDKEIYRFKISINRTVHEDTEKDNIVESNLLQISVLKEKEVEPRKMSFDYYLEDDYVDTKKINLMKNNIIINKAKLINTVPLPLIASGKFVPQKIHGTKISTKKYFKKLKNFIIETFYNKHYNDLRISDNIENKIIDELKEDNLHFKFIKDTYITPYANMLNHPGIAFYLKSYDKSKKNIRLSDSSWKVYSDNEKKYSAVEEGREFEFVRNPANFITHPNNDGTNYQILNFEHDFTFDQSESLREMKICALGEYVIILNGITIKADQFRFNYRDFNLFKDEEILAKFQNNLKRDNNIVIKLKYNENVIDVLNIPKVSVKFNNNNQTIVTDSTWMSSVSLNSNCSQKDAWNFTNWDSVRVLENYKNSIWYNEKIPLDSEGEIIRYFSKGINTFSNNTRLEIVDNSSNFISTFFLDGREFTKDIIISNSGHHILGIQSIVHFNTSISTNSIKQSIKRDNVKSVKTIENPYIYNNYKSPIIYDRNHNMIADNSIINGRSKRLYADNLGLSSLIGYKNFSKNIGIGIERSLAKLNSLSDFHDDFEVELTIDSDWQKIAIQTLNEMIDAEIVEDNIYIKKNSFLPNKNRKKKTADFLRLKKEYSAGMLICNENGEILVSASYPYLKNYNEKDLQNALFDFTFSKQATPISNINLEKRFYPGSSFKILDALTIFSANELLPVGDKRIRYIRKIINGYPKEAGITNLTTSHFLNESNRYLKVNISNHNNHSCPQGTKIKKAFAKSYNTYFAYAMLHLNSFAVSDPDKFILSKSVDQNIVYQEFPLYYWLDKLNFNQSSYLLNDYNDSNESLFYDLKIQKSIYKSSALEQAEIAHLSIGQSIVEVTPYKQIEIVSLIEQGNGFSLRPYLIKSIKKNDRNIYEKKQSKNKVSDLRSRNYILVKELMRDVVVKGTGRLLKQFEDKTNNRFKFYAKTGTAEIYDEMNINHAWFVGFFEDQETNQKYYFAVVFPFTQKEGAGISGKALKNFMEKLWEEYYE